MYIEDKWFFLTKSVSLKKSMKQLVIKIVVKVTYKLRNWLYTNQKTSGRWFLEYTGAVFELNSHSYLDWFLSLANLLVYSQVKDQSINY